MKIIEFRENHEAKTGDLRNFEIFGEIFLFLEHVILEHTQNEVSNMVRAWP